MNYLIEEPIFLTEENDFLGTLKKANAITHFIENNTDLLNFNNMIALYGEWGSGKSSVLKTIESNLSKDKYKLIWIDMWKEESDYTNLSVKILNRILSSLDIKTETKKSILKAFFVLGKGVKINAGIISYDMNPAFEQLNKELENEEKVENFISSFQDQIDKYYKKTGKKVIVFLDDLDRCDSNNMLNIIYNVKLLLSTQNVIFVFGIDKDAITLALKNKYNNEANKAESFLEKIFPISFNMPHEIMNKENIDIIIRRVSDDLKEDAYENIRNFFDKMKFNNPREIIKVVNKYKLIEKELETKNLLNIKNEWNIILILFLIMEHEFNINNYVEMIKDNKKHLLGNVIKFNLNGTKMYSNLNKKNIGYEEYPIHLLSIETQNNKTKENYLPIELYEYFCNPQDLIKNEIPVVCLDTHLWVQVKFEIWMESFKDSINKRFCYLLKENRSNIIDCFSEGTEENKYNIFLNKLKELVSQIDLLL